MIKGMWITFGRELRSLFFNPVGWLILLLFYLAHGFETYNRVRLFSNGGDANYFASAYTFSLLNYFVLVLAPPLLTMRAFADERRSGSLEVLMTAPVREASVVLGKWLAALAFWSMLWLPTILILVVLRSEPFLNADVPLAPVLTGFFGMFLCGSVFLAAGCLFSSLTDNVMLAAILGILFNFVLLILPNLLHQSIQPIALEHHWVLVIYEKLHLHNVLGNWFARGLLDTSQVVAFAAATMVILFLNTLTLGMRRWR